MYINNEAGAKISRDLSMGSWEESGAGGERLGDSFQRAVLYIRIHPSPEPEVVRRAGN